MRGRRALLATASVPALLGVVGACALPALAQGAAHAASVTYPPVVAQALAALADRGAPLTLGAPTTLPTEPPSHTFLTALTQVRGRGWRVELLKADQAYAVNNPAIESAHAHAVGQFAFGASALAAPLPSHTSAAVVAALWRDGLRAQGLDPKREDGLPAAGAIGSPVALGHGITGRLFSDAGGVDSLVWREGDWTLAVVDTTGTTTLALARPVVAYLHSAYMPPHPGLVFVSVGVHGVVTRIDWTTGATLYWIDNVLEAGDNPVDACAMAVSWRGAGQ